MTGRSSLYEQGYALFLVTAVCALCFIIVTGALANVLSQEDEVRIKEAGIRAENLVLSGYALWMAEEWETLTMEKWDRPPSEPHDTLSSLTGMGKTRSFHMDDGTINVTVREVTEKEVILDLEAQVEYRLIKRTVQVVLSLENGRILEWRSM